jgi:hypothetical protein
MTGSFSGGTHAEAGMFKRVLALFTPKAYALNPSAVSRVLVFCAQTHAYQTANVVNNAFSIKLERGNPVGLIFLGSSNQFLGYLTLQNGIESLPVKRIKSNVATVDLGTLSSSGQIVEPGHNPVGDEIPLTDDERDALAQYGGLFSAIVKNPDVDGNEVVDLLEGKTYFMELTYNFVGGAFSGNPTPTVNTRLERYQIHTFSNTSSCPDSVTMTGPIGSPLANPTTLARVQVGSYCTHRYLSPLSSGNDLDMPKQGDYRVDFPGETLTFQVPNQVHILTKAVAIVPTVTLDSNGKIQKISWSYRPADGSNKNLNPEHLITQIQITLADLQFSANGLYNSQLITSTNTTEIDLSGEGLYWNQVGCVNTSYHDVYGNGYTFKWEK